MGGTAATGNIFLQWADAMAANQPTVNELITILHRLDYLLAGEGVIAANEAERFGVCVRTIKRHLVELRNLAGPTYVDRVSQEIHRHYYERGVLPLFNPKRKLKK